MKEYSLQTLYDTVSLSLSLCCCRYNLSNKQVFQIDFKLNQQIVNNVNCLQQNRDSGGVIFSCFFLQQNIQPSIKQPKLSLTMIIMSNLWGNIYQECYKPSDMQHVAHTHTHSYRPNPPSTLEHTIFTQKHTTPLTHPFNPLSMWALAGICKLTRVSIDLKIFFLGFYLFGGGHHPPKNTCYDNPRFMTLQL